MPSGKQRRQDRLPPELISRESLDKLRARIKAAGVPLPSSEPDWQALRRSVQEDHGLADVAAEEFARALERLWLLPFHRYDACAPPLLVFFAELPSVEKRLHARRDPDGLSLCAAFRVMAEMMLHGVQGGSASAASQWPYGGRLIVRTRSSFVAETNKALGPRTWPSQSLAAAFCGCSSSLAVRSAPKWCD